MKKFEKGSIYYSRDCADYNNVSVIKVINTSGKTLKFINEDGEHKTCRIKQNETEGFEFVTPKKQYFIAKSELTEEVNGQGFYEYVHKSVFA